MYGASDDRESLATVDAALDAGVTLIDTGDFYGSGLNEMLIGRALKSRRGQVVLSVKFGGMRGPDGAWIGIDARPVAVKNFLTYSLCRLGTYYIDDLSARPAGSHRTDRGHDRSNLGTDPGRLRARAWAFRTRSRDNLPSPTCAPDRRRATRILRDQPGGGNSDSATMRAIGDRTHGVRCPFAGFADWLPACRYQRLPQASSTIQWSESGAQPETC